MQSAAAAADPAGPAAAVTVAVAVACLVTIAETATLDVPGTENSAGGPNNAGPLGNGNFGDKLCKHLFTNYRGWGSRRQLSGLLHDGNAKAMHSPNLMRISSAAVFVRLLNILLQTCS